MKYRLITFITGFCILTTGCNKEETYKDTVKNNSQYDLKLVAFKKKGVSGTLTAVDSFIISKGSEAIINQAMGETRVSDCSVPPFDSIACIVQNQPGLKLSFNLVEASRYIFSRTGSNRKGYNTECRATISDADIVPK